MTATVINPMRGEIGFAGWIIRPTFGALVAAEETLGPLFALVERASDGRLSLQETAQLIWHCINDRDDDVTVDDVGAVVLRDGLVHAVPVVRQILAAILHGAG